MQCTLKIFTIRYKFEVLELLLADNTDIFIISETKRGGTFPLSQIQIYGFTSSYRPDPNDRGQRRFIDRIQTIEEKEDYYLKEKI